MVWSTTTDIYNELGIKVCIVHTTKVLLNELANKNGHRGCTADRRSPLFRAYPARLRQRYHRASTNRSNRPTPCRGLKTRRPLQHFVRRVVRCRSVRAHAAVHISKYANPVYPPPLNVEIPIYRESIKSIKMVQLVTDAVSIIWIHFRWNDRFEFLFFFFGDTLCLPNNTIILLFINSRSSFACLS